MRTTSAFRRGTISGGASWFSEAEPGTGYKIGKAGLRSIEGYGLIPSDNGGKDVFVHISAVEKAGMSGLNDGTPLPL